MLTRIVTSPTIQDFLNKITVLSVTNATCFNFSNMDRQNSVGLMKNLSEFSLIVDEKTQMSDFKIKLALNVRRMVQTVKDITVSNCN